LVKNLSLETNIPVPDLLKVYGEHVFHVFIKAHHKMIPHCTNAFSLLSIIENTIHVNVLKLYPDAELPSFEIESSDDKVLVMIYKSKRKLSDFAEGLIKGALNYFKEEAEIKKELLVDDGSVAKITITIL